MTTLLGLLLALATQDGELDRILLRHGQKIEKAGTPAERKKVDGETRADLDEFLRLHRGHADAPRAAWLRAQTWSASGDLDRAAADLRAVLKDWPEAEVALTARISLAEILLQKEDWAAARAACADFSTRFGRDERACYAKILTGIAWQGEGEIDRAAGLFREARSDHPTRPESWSALLQLAVCLHSAERNAEARKTLEDVIQGCPDRNAVEAARKHLAVYLRLGTEAPTFSTTELGGGKAGSADFAGRVAVLYFFDSTLTTAVTESAFLKRLRGEQKSADLVVLGISVDRDRRDLLHFKDEFSIDWPLGFDGRGYDGAAARAWDVRQLPALSAIDRKGRFRYFNLAGSDLRRAIAKLLQEK